MSESLQYDLKYIKKHYGEKFAHLCRELFPTILEEEGLLSRIIADNFAPTRTLYDTVIDQKSEFKAYIYELAGIKIEATEKVKTNKTPKELLDEAGYILYDECMTEKDIQKFVKYYEPDEKICTFKGDRLDTCRVWFAVKKNVDDIKRENFTHPHRQDEYGTSVISIQFTIDMPSTLSIKNRYNHTVKNPDATFSNNLDNIIEGLTDAFVRQYNIKLADESETKINLDDYAVDLKGKKYFINIRTIEKKYCENNIILEGGSVTAIDKSRYILMENYVVDLQKNKIFNYENKNLKNEEISDSFVKSLGEIKKINLSKDKAGNKVIVVVPEEGENVEITLDQHNEILGYKNHNVKEIGNYFLNRNKSINFIDIPNVAGIGHDFLARNKALVSISLPKVELVGNYFLDGNDILSNVDMPQVRELGDRFLVSNSRLKYLELPKATKIGKYFLGCNEVLESLILPQVLETGADFLAKNTNLTRLYMPKLLEAKRFFLCYNNSLTILDLPSLQIIDSKFLSSNYALEEVNLPKLPLEQKAYLPANIQRILKKNETNKSDDKIL